MLVQGHNDALLVNWLHATCQHDGALWGIHVNAVICNSAEGGMPAHTRTFFLCRTRLLWIIRE